jgi:hypothetical protein
MRICNRCKAEKSLDNFHRKATVKDGRAAVCKDCRKIVYREKHPKKIRVRSPPKTIDEKRRYYESRTAKNLWCRAKYRAKMFGMLFNLSIEDVQIPKFCPVLGIELNWSVGKKGNAARGNSPSLDRIDNAKGYIKGNTLVISHRANCIKRDATISELRRLADFYTELQTRPEPLTEHHEMDY